MTTYGVTAASSQLGVLVLDELLTKVAPGDIVATTRDPAKLASYAAKGVAVRLADYDDPASLATALAGVDRLLFISGNEVGRRETQHGNVIDVAKQAGVSYVAYTSVLNGEASRLPVAPEHVATERLLAESGLDYDLLRHGWYSENYTAALAHQVESGEVVDATGDGRISAATRADFAAGDVAALLRGSGGTVYELAGDEAFTMADFARILSEVSGKPVSFRNLSPADYARVLEQSGVPGPFATMLADSSAGAAAGELENHSGDLSRLAGRPTTPIRETIRQALGG